MSLLNQSIIEDIRGIIFASKDNAFCGVYYERTLMCRNIGKRIFEAEQQGKDRVDYGSYLIKYLSEQLHPEFGSGFLLSATKMVQAVLSSIPNCVRTADTIINCHHLQFRPHCGRNSVPKGLYICV